MRPMLKRMQCQQHPAYSASLFCARPQCGFGLLCPACEELEHAALRHHSMDGLGIDHLIKAETFIDDIFGGGLHYEEKEQLVPDVPKTDYKMLAEASSKFEKIRAKKLQELEDQLNSYQKDVVTRIELRFKKLKRDLVEEFNKAYEKETRPLRYVCQALENVYRKREVSLDRLLTELEFAKLASEQSVSSKKPKKTEEDGQLDMQKCALAFQGHLEATYNRLDVQYMSDARKAIDYLKATESRVKVDLDKLRDLISNRLMEDLEQAFERVTEITTIDNGGIEDLLARDNYPDNLGKDISSRYARGPAVSETRVDKRVTLAADCAITAVCWFANELVVVGFQNGTLKVALPHRRPSRDSRSSTLSSPKASAQQRHTSRASSSTATR